jgi:hypothetical protein
MSSAVKKGNGTRRISNRRKFLTIPEIKASFDKIEQATYRILREGGTLDEQVKKFKVEWKDIFHRPVRTESAEAYLKMKQASKKRPTKTRKQKGGAATHLSGAPLDHALHPPPSSGSYLTYQVSGMNPPGIAMDASCGIINSSPTPQSIDAAQTAQRGGSVGDLVHRMFMTPSEGTPSGSFRETVSDILNGRPTAPSPAPYSSALKY